MTTPFGIGKVIARGFQIWGRNVVAFLLIAGLVYSPVLLWGISVARDADAHAVVNFFAFVTTYLLWPLQLLVSAVVTYGVVRELQGQRVSAGACIIAGFRRALPALGTLVLVLLSTFGLVMFVSFALGMLLAPFGRAIFVAYAAVLGVWFWFTSKMYVAIQASATERQGAVNAMARSADLTMGHRLAIIAIYLLQAVTSSGLLIAIQQLTWGSVAIYVCCSLALCVTTGSLWAVMHGVAYYLLRTEKDGTSTPELAAIFD